MRCCCSSVAVCADCATAPNSWPMAARRFTCPGSAPCVISSHGGVSTFSAASRPVSVSSKSYLLPSVSLAVMRPSSSNSCNLGYTEPGLGYHSQMLRSASCWIIT